MHVGCIDADPLTISNFDFFISYAHVLAVLYNHFCINALFVFYACDGKMDFTYVQVLNI